jgi:hypothetical protein
MHNEEFYNLYASPSIIRMIKSRRMRWEERIEGIREIINVNKVCIGKSEGTKQLGRPRHE